MKKAGRISGKISGKTVCCFHYFIVCGGEAGRKSEKDIFFGALKGLEKRVSRKFEPYMMGKMGVWHLRKNLVLFGPPDMQKTQEFPGFFGPASFLLGQSEGQCRIRTCEPPPESKSYASNVAIFNINMHTLLNNIHFGLGTKSLHLFCSAMKMRELCSSAELDFVSFRI